MKNVIMALGCFWSLLLSIGCATEYSCGQFPSSGCQPISMVYEKTNGNIYDYRKDLYEKSHREIPTKKERRASAARSPIENIDRIDSEQGEVTLKKPKILKVQLGNWVDEDKVLHSGGSLFIKIRDVEWISKNEMED